MYVYAFSSITTIKQLQIHLGSSGWECLVLCACSARPIKCCVAFGASALYSCLQNPSVTNACNADATHLGGLSWNNN